MKLEKEKTIICVSTLLTWNQTNKKTLSVDDLPSRKSYFHFLKELENMCLDLHSINDKVQGYVLATGIVYGLGEKQLLPLFKQAILQNPEELTIVGDGKNFIPMIHIADLCQQI